MAGAWWSLFRYAKGDMILCLMGSYEACQKWMKDNPADDYILK
jgi:hypothetical protein